MFLIYDYVITFGREVEMFWRSKFTGASVLFFANRYVSLLFNTMGLVTLGRFTDEVRSLRDDRGAIAELELPRGLHAYLWMWMDMALMTPCCP